MNGMKCGKKGAQKLISEFVESCTGEFFFDWLIEKNKLRRGRLEIIGGMSLEWYRSCGIWMMGECAKKIIIINKMWTDTS